MTNPVTGVGSTAESGNSADHTVQAFVELVYVQTANNVMVEQMASLENALNVTQNGVNILTSLQNLHNAVGIQQRAPLGTIDPGISTGSYTTLATQQFNTPLQVSANFTSVGGSQAFLSQMRSAEAQMSALLVSLRAITPATGTAADSNSLLANMSQVLKDIKNTVFNGNAAGTIAGAKTWLTDQYNNGSTVSTSAGIYQQHITNALTAAQSLNTTQTESVRNFLYVYEEYYKSASAVLTAITQIISKMAGGISR